jgi:hypothetical protein
MKRHGSKGLSLRLPRVGRLGLLFGAAWFVGAVFLASIGSSPAIAADKPNILVIMTDDVGMWNIGAYHRGMMGGRTPNIDRIAKKARC